MLSMRNLFYLLGAFLFIVSVIRLVVMFNGGETVKDEVKNQMIQDTYERINHYNSIMDNHEIQIEKAKRNRQAEIERYIKLVWGVERGVNVVVFDWHEYPTTISGRVRVVDGVVYNGVDGKPELYVIKKGDNSAHEHVFDRWALLDDHKEKQKVIESMAVGRVDGDKIEMVML